MFTTSITRPGPHTITICSLFGAASVPMKFCGEFERMRKSYLRKQQSIDNHERKQ
jgi:hypothetical protein